MLPLWLAQAIETEEDRSKMEQLYDAHQRLMYSVAFRYLHDEFKAEDAVHDAFLRVINILDNIDDPKCPQTRGLLVIIVEHICIDMLKSKSYSAEVYLLDDNDYYSDSLVPDSYQDIEDAYAEKNDAETILDALRKLPKILRDTMFMYAVEGLSMKEIASVDDCSVEAVKKRIQRARTQIKSILGETQCVK